MRDSFIFYRSFYEAISDLDDSQQLEIYQAMANFSLNFKEPILSGVSATIFKLIKPQLEANNKRYLNGSQPKHKQEESRTEAEQKQHKSNIEANKNKNVKEKENKKEYSKEFEDMFDWYRKNTSRPIGEKKKAYLSYLKLLKTHPFDTVKRCVFNYVTQCNNTKTFTKHLVSFLNSEILEYTSIQPKQQIQQTKSQKDEGILF